MIWILLTILSATGIFVFFKLLDKFHLPNLNAIVINYLTAGVLGFLISDNPSMIGPIFNQSWSLLAILIGILFILMFFIIGYSSKTSGMSLTTLASKMSVVIPMAFSIIFYGESLNLIKALGIILAIGGLIMAVFKKRKDGKLGKHFWLPIFLFFGMGCVDSLVKFAQEAYISDDISAIFTALLFSISFVIGLIILSFKPSLFQYFKNIKLILIGIGLGIVNYGSIYFLIRAFNTNILDSSVIFGINNIGIVSLSSIIGLGFFKEKLSRLNWIGLFICIIAIAILYITG
jgi:drug/metabolite transporter (DMT)-like permease